MLRTGTVVFRRYCRTSCPTQIGLILGFWLIGEFAVKATGLPIPGGIFGLFIVFGLLVTNQISIRSVERGARWFLGEMLLFFVPAVLVVLDHPEFVGILGLKILAVIALGTIIVMTVTAVFVELTYMYMMRKAKEGQDVK